MYAQLCFATVKKAFMQHPKFRIFYFMMSEESTGNIFKLMPLFNSEEISEEKT